MEKPLQKLLIQHFSHEHFLKRWLLPPDENCICFGCKHYILPGKHCYKCETCPFNLHQVCYTMPQKVQHPVDPNHHLTLLAMPLSTDNSIKCEACEDTITGFYYNCASCGHFYHMLCLATPLSVKLPVHPHTLKIEFSPPYKFQCDLCDRPSHRGWLYRCGLCEFDVHISCAIMDLQAKLQLLPQTNSLDIDGRKDADNKRHELMALLLQGIAGIQDNENFPSQSQHQYQLTPMSDYTATPSFQFSDACFSIDIEQSFINDGLESKEADFINDGPESKEVDFINDGLESKEADFHQVQVQESKETNKIGYVVVSKGIVHDPKLSAITVAKNPLFDSGIRSPQKGQKFAISPAIGSHVWMDLGQENEPTKPKASNDIADLRHQTNKSVCFRCLCW